MNHHAPLQCGSLEEGQDCAPIWPSTSPCNNRGVCVNGTCVCFPGWTGKSDYTDFEGIDCVTNIPARVTLAAIALVIFVVDSICAILALKRYYSVKGTVNLLRPGIAAKNGLWSLGDKIFLIPLYVAMACGYYVHENIGLGILLICGSAFPFGRAAEGNIRIFRVLMKPLNFDLYRKIFVLVTTIGMAIFNAALLAGIIAGGWPFNLGKKYLNQITMARFYFGWQAFFIFVFWIVILPFYMSLINILAKEENPDTIRKNNRRKEMLAALRLSFKMVLGVTSLMMAYLLVNAFMPIVQSYEAFILYSLSALGAISVNLNYYRRGKADFLEEGTDSARKSTEGHQVPSQATAEKETTVNSSNNKHSTSSSA